MKRNYGIDGLRLVCMFMNVVGHILVHGGIIGTTEPLSTNFHLEFLLKGLCICAVNCFAMITGYVNYRAKYRLSSLATLFLQVLLYSLGITACTWIFKPELFSWSRLAFYGLPVTSNAYWYFSAYVGLFIIMPLLNAGIKAMNERQTKLMLVLTFAVFYIFPAWSGVDGMDIGGGFSMLHLACFYVLGAAMNKYDWFRNTKPVKAFAVYALCIVLAWLCEMGFIRQSLHTGDGINILHMLDYAAPAVIVASAALVVAFKNLSVPSGAAKVIGVLAPAAFGVYLIHEHNMVRRYLITDRFVFLSTKNPFVLVLGAIGIALLLFAACLAVDMVRVKVFQWLRIKERLTKLEEKWLNGRAEPETEHSSRL